MSGDQLPYILLMVFSASLSAFIAVRVSRSKRKVARSASFTMMALCGSIWMALVTLETLITSLAWRQALWILIPFVILCTLTGLFFFSLEFSLRYKQVPRSVLYPTIILTILVTGLSLTNPLHHQMWTIVVVNGEVIQVMGRFFFIQLAYTYLLTLASLTLLVRAFLRSKGALRRQTALLLVGILFPVLISIAADGFGWKPLPFIDVPALSIVFTVILFWWATLQFNNFYLLPVASDVIIRNMQDGILVTDMDGLIFFSNPAAHKIFGIKGNQLNDQPVSKILAEWQPGAFYAWDTGKEEAQLIVGGDQPQYYRLSISQLLGSANDAVGSLLTLHNNTDQKNYEKRLNELAIRDPLTDCYNRRYFFEMTQAFFSLMERSSRPLSILMLDIDHFKVINDNYGHARGDQVLQKMAALCKSLVRSQDIFSRYGGEEFVLAMPETCLQKALLVAERLRNAVESMNNELEELPITVSIGVVETVGEVGLTLDLLVNRADEAMYLSKRAGRNRVSVWENPLERTS